MIFFRKTLGCIVLIISGLLAAVGTVNASGVLHTEGQTFRDPQGRVVILRGINVSGDAKVTPFIPLLGPGRDGKVDLSLLDPLPRWGFNVLRLLFIWDAYEPEPGHYDEEYLRQLTEIADAAWARGMYVVIDMHQDSYSRYLSNGCGEGFPAWTVPPYLRQNHSRETAGHCGPLWALGRAMSRSMHYAYRDFYSDRFGARTAFVALWSRLARHFRAHPGVIGYDILNEPWGNENRELGPLYRDAARAIRTEDPTSILFIEPQVFLCAFGFRQTRLIRPMLTNFAYSPHFYDPVAAGLKAWAHWTGFITRHGFNSMASKARQWDVPLLVGEFGVLGRMKSARAFIDFQYDQFDGRFISGAQWNYTPSWNATTLDGWNQEDLSIVDHLGNLRRNYRPRPYARYIAGTPVAQYEHRYTTGRMIRYVLEWNHASESGETEAYVPSEVIAHPESFDIDWAGKGLSCVVEPDQLRIKCRSADSGAMQLRIVEKTRMSRADN